MPDLNIDLLNKMMALAGHPETPAEEALNALRFAHQLLDRCGKSFADLMNLDTEWEMLKQCRRRVAALERLSSDLEVKVEEARHELRAQAEVSTALKRQVRDQSKKIKEQEKLIRKQARLIASQSSEIDELGAAAETWKARNASLKIVKEPVAVVANRAGIQAAASDIQGFIAALKALRKIDPDMRIKAALAFLLTVTNDGLAVSELAERIGDTSEGSIRYTMRALGQGWPGKRPGQELVLDCADPNSGRKRLYVAADRGRAALQVVLDALQSENLASDLKMAA